MPEGAALLLVVFVVRVGKCCPGTTSHLFAVKKVYQYIKSRLIDNENFDGYGQELV